MSFGFRVFAAAALIVHSLSACSNGEADGSAAREQVSAKPSVASTADVEQGKLVLAFGDSLYAGYGVLPQQSFPWRLQEALKARGVVATVRNAGVSGDTTAAGRQRLAYTLDGLKTTPDLVLVGLGGNDMLRGISPEETEANLRAILEELKRRNIPAMLTGMVAAPNLGRPFATQFNAIYPALSREFGVDLYPFFLDEVVTDPALMQADRIHPNPAGIDRVVAKVTPLVAQHLKSDAPSATD